VSATHVAIALRLRKPRKSCERGGTEDRLDHCIPSVHSAAALTQSPVAATGLPPASHLAAGAQVSARLLMRQGFCPGELLMRVDLSLLWFCVQMPIAPGGAPHAIQANPGTRKLYCTRCGAEKGEAQFDADCSKVVEGAGRSHRNAGAGLDRVQQGWAAL
jgi:hypothetical protein